MSSRDSDSHDSGNTIALALLVLIVFGMAAYNGCWYLVGLAGPGNDDYCFDIMNGYELCRTSSRSRLIAREENVLINADVQRLAWDDRYIFAERFGPRIPYNATSPQGEDYLDWWIIDTADETTEGPLEKDLFDRRVAELISRGNIRLHDTELYGREGKLQTNSQILPTPQ